MKISIQLYIQDLLQEKQSFFEKFLDDNAILRNESLDTAFPLLKKAGINGIELVVPLSLSKEKIHKVKRILKKYDIKILSIHQPVSFLPRFSLRDINKLFNYTRNFEAKVLVIHIDSLGDLIFKKESIRRLHELEERYGIFLGFENSQRHIFSFAKRYKWHPAFFSSAILTSKFHMTLDTTHLGQVGGNIVTFFNDYKKSIVNIHLSNYKDHSFSSTFRPFTYVHLPLNKGDLPIRKFVRLLQKEKYAGLVTLEINHATLPLICENIEWLKKVLQD